MIRRRAHTGPLLSGLLHDLVASGAATWRDGDGMVGGDRTVVVDAGEGLAVVMKDCDCLGIHCGAAYPRDLACAPCRHSRLRTHRTG